MGSINGDRGLCQLTNVLKSENTKKKDIYAFFLEELKKKGQDTSLLDMLLVGC